MFAHELLRLSWRESSLLVSGDRQPCSAALLDERAAWSQEVFPFYLGADGFGGRCVALEVDGCSVVTHVFASDWLHREERRRDSAALLVEHIKGGEGVPLSPR